jgi:hypothetical protein
MSGKGAVRRGKARLQRGQCKTLAALFFCCTLMTSWPGHLPPVEEQRFWREAGPLIRHSIPSGLIVE